MSIELALRSSRKEQRAVTFDFRNKYFRKAKYIAGELARSRNIVQQTKFDCCISKSIRTMYVFLPFNFDEMTMIFDFNYLLTMIRAASTTPKPNETKRKRFGRKQATAEKTGNVETAKRKKYPNTNLTKDKQNHICAKFMQN